MPTRTKPLFGRSEGSFESLRKVIAEEKGVVNSIRWQAHASNCDTFCTSEPKKNHSNKSTRWSSFDGQFDRSTTLHCSDITTQVGFRDFHEEKSTLVSPSDLKYPLAFLLSNHLLCTILCHGNWGLRPDLS